MLPAEVLVSTYPGRLQMERQLELLRARAQLQPSDRQLAPKAVVGTAADELGTASQRYSADCSTHKIERPPWLGLAGPAHPGFPLVNLGPYRGIRLPSRRVRLPSRWCSTTVVISRFASQVLLRLPLGIPFSRGPLMVCELQRELPLRLLGGSDFETPLRLLRGVLLVTAPPRLGSMVLLIHREYQATARSWTCVDFPPSGALPRPFCVVFRSPHVVGSATQ
jgi:hypothetical protein